ncbi:ComEC/Rec2 family competence protein [Williamsia maris]|uniref:ComEC/Rec2 family competence protein n=1 Tax=Williamsia maris TaxID=72806 RepID=UPI0020A42658|nr:ComEC/Rec2 family competence protein [Williamsia maris]
MIASRSDAVGADLRLLAPAAGCWAVTITGAVGGVWAGGVATALCAVVLTTTVLVVRRGERAHALRPVMLLVIATAGVSAGFGAAVTARVIDLQQHPMAAADLVGHKTTAELLIGDDPRVLRGPGPPRIRVPVAASVLSPPSDRAAATLTAPLDGWSDLVPGQRVTAVVTVDRPYRADLTVASLRATGPPRAVSRPPGYQRWASTVRLRFAERSRRALPAAESGLLPGLVLGDVSGLGADVADDFTRCGLTHLTAVSGANFAIVCGAVLLVLQAVGVGRRTSAVLAAIVLACFVVLVRPSPSVVRAAVMGAVGLLALVAGRRSAAIPALCAAVIMALGVWPALAVDPGFALSVCATAALILLAPTLRDRLCAAGIPRGVADLLAIALAAQIVTAPLIAMIAGTVNVVGVAANLAVALAVAPITVLGTVAAAIVGLSPRVGELLIRFCEPELWWMVRTADVLARVPGASVSVPDGVGGALWVALVVAAPAVGVWLWRRTGHGRAGVVGGVWHDGRRDRPTPPPARRRRVPGRARHRGDPQAGERRDRYRRADHPGPGG